MCFLQLPHVEYMPLNRIFVPLCPLKFRCDFLYFVVPLFFAFKLSGYLKMRFPLSSVHRHCVHCISVVIRSRFHSVNPSNFANLRFLNFCSFNILFPGNYSQCSGNSLGTDWNFIFWISSRSYSGNRIDLNFSTNFDLKWEDILFPECSGNSVRWTVSHWISVCVHTATENVIYYHSPWTALRTNWTLWYPMMPKVYRTVGSITKDSWVTAVGWFKHNVENGTTQIIRHNRTVPVIRIQWENMWVLFGIMPMIQRDVLPVPTLQIIIRSMSLSAWIWQESFMKIDAIMMQIVRLLHFGYVFVWSHGDWHFFTSSVLSQVFANFV